MMTFKRLIREFEISNNLGIQSYIDIKIYFDEK